MLVGATSFDAFYASTARRTLSLAYALTGNWGDAEDLVQDAFSAAARRWGVVGEQWLDPSATIREVTVAPIIAGTGRRGSVALSAALPDGNFGTVEAFFSATDLYLSIGGSTAWPWPLVGSQLVQLYSGRGADNACAFSRIGKGTAVSLRVTRINADRYIAPLVPVPDAPGIIGACLRTPTNEIAQADMVDAQGKILDQIGGHS